MWFLGLIIGAIIGAIGGGEGALAGAIVGMVAGIAIRRKDPVVDETWKRNVEDALRQLHQRVEALERSLDHLSGGKGLDVGVSDELPHAPLHRANGTTHHERLCTALAVVPRDAEATWNDPTRFAMPPALATRSSRMGRERCQTPISVKRALWAMSDRRSGGA